MAGTLAEKVWRDHVVRKGTGGEPDLLYIDLHLVHEVTSPQAFEGLRLADRPVRRPDLTIATEDQDRKSTRLNSSHVAISYVVFCLKQKRIKGTQRLDNGSKR